MDIEILANIRWVGGGHGWVWTSQKGYNYYNYVRKSDAVQAALEHWRIKC